MTKKRHRNLMETPSKRFSARTPLTPNKSPAQSKAKKVMQKYKRAFRVSPGKLERVKLALNQVEEGVSLRKAAKNAGLSPSFLYRRLNGQVKVDSRNGPSPIFNTMEEAKLAQWLTEMSKRGMGLTPGDFLDFVASIIKKDKRKNNFKDGRPGYTWYHKFMARNSHIVQLRKESALDNSRAKVTSKQLDLWFRNYYKFVSELHLLDKPHRIYNADESGFSMGSKASKVIGPTKADYCKNLPHVCGQSKKRLTGMFCASADGSVLPPFLIYPMPKPTAFDPLIGSRIGTVIEYTEKGWMNSQTFLKFLEHFNEHATKDRPVVLLIDSVSSHIDINVFTFAKENNIELYRLIPNATHFLQPLDNGVFGPLKKMWYKIVRQFTRANPGKVINKENFAAKLNEAFLQFYKPITVVNSFKSTGTFPVDRSRVSEDQLKPALTFSLEKSSSVLTSPAKCSTVSTVTVANLTATSISEAEANTDSNSHQQSSLDLDDESGLEILASAALLIDNNNNALSNSVCLKEKQNESSMCFDSSIIVDDETVSSCVKDALVFPSCSQYDTKRKRKSAIESQPNDCLTSSESIRNAALKELEKVKKFAKKEMAVKSKYLKEKAKALKSSKMNVCKGKNKKSSIVTCDNVTCDNLTSVKTKRNKRAKKTLLFDKTLGGQCASCKLSTDKAGTTWVQCDLCDHWFHVSCIPEDHEYDQQALVCEDVEYFCHICVS